MQQVIYTEATIPAPRYPELLDMHMQLRRLVRRQVAAVELTRALARQVRDGDAAARMAALREQLLSQLDCVNDAVARVPGMTPDAR